MTLRSWIPSLAGLVLGCSHRAVDVSQPAWTNTAPTRVEQVVSQAEGQLLLVSQGSLRTWVSVPDVGAEIGDFILLTQGSPRYEVEIPGVGAPAPVVVDIPQARVVDAETAARVVRASTPADAVPTGTVYAELGTRAGKPIVVAGTVVKATRAVGAFWVHLQDGTGDAAAETHDLTVRTQERVVVGQRVAFRGVLQQDVELGFGYHYVALVDGGVLLD